MVSVLEKLHGKSSRMFLKNARRRSVIVLLALIVVGLSTGCQNDKVREAEKLNKRSLIETKKIKDAGVAAVLHSQNVDDRIDESAVLIEDVIGILDNAYVTAVKYSQPLASALIDARVKAIAAEQKLVSTTQPSAKQENKEVRKSLQPIAASTEKINAISNKQVVVTKKAVEDLTDERSHFWSFKQRSLFYIGLAVLPLIGLVVFAIKVGGGGEIMEVVGETIAGVLRVLKKMLLWVVKAAVHIFTLGGSWLADRVNAKYISKDDTASTNKG